MPQNAFFPPRTRDLLVSQKNDSKTLFPHPPSPFPGKSATATMVAFVRLRNSWLNFHCYTQREATPTQKSARKWRCDLSRLLARKITKGIHSCKPAALNRPIALAVGRFSEAGWCHHCLCTQLDCMAGGQGNHHRRLASRRRVWIVEEPDAVLACTKPRVWIPHWSITWRREAWEEEALNDLPCKVEKGPSSTGENKTKQNKQTNKQTLVLFQRRRWGQFRETGWSV